MNDGPEGFKPPHRCCRVVAGLFALIRPVGRAPSNQPHRKTFVGLDDLTTAHRDANRDLPASSFARAVNKFVFLNLLSLSTFTLSLFHARAATTTTIKKNF